MFTEEDLFATPLPSSVEEVPSCMVQYLVSNPVAVVLSLAKLLPARSLAPVVTLILYVVLKERLSEGANVNVVLSVFDEGVDEDICIQLLKLSEDN